MTSHKTASSDRVVQIKPSQLRWFRLRRSGLVLPFRTAEECVRRLVGVQAQMLNTAALAIARRVPTLSLRELDSILYERRRLVRTWGQRQTLHLYHTSDWPLFIAALRSRRTWAHERFLEEGRTEAEYRALLETTVEILRKQRTISRTELAKHLGKQLSTWGGLLVDVAYQGLLCLSGPATYSYGDDWLKEEKRDDNRTRTAEVEIIRRYLFGYGPATVQDAAYWFGCTVKDAREWFAPLKLSEVICEGVSLLALVDDIDELKKTQPPDDGDYPIIFLYRFDPLLLAYKDKQWFVPKSFTKQVWGAAGQVAGVILETGVAVATWRYEREKKKVKIEVSPFGKLSRNVKRQIDVQQDFLQRFLISGIV